MKLFIGPALLVALLIGVLLTLVVLPALLDFLTIDSCLDLGGRWNSISSECEGATDFVSLHERPFAVAILALLLLASTAWAALHLIARPLIALIFKKRG